MSVRDLHREIHFEDAICLHLAGHGWLYTEGDAERYDRDRALFLPDLVAWLEATQPDAWAALGKAHGDSVRLDVLADRLRKCLNERGVLDVLRQGVSLVGARGTLSLLQSRPASGLNPELETHYHANRLRVMRQLHHSPNQPHDALDLVLFLNGIPVATAELKSDFTQCVEDAVDQYRRDRLPFPKGGRIEPLLSFPGGAPVHFAVSQREVMMTTRLDGTNTRFLPFNQGNDGGAGNPPSPDGFATAYLWEDVWQRDHWLELLGRYLIGVRDDKKKLAGVIFPRYHQWDVTRKLLAAVAADGVGGKYLVQHSAGSGKTNSIAWCAHFLSDQHDADHRKRFDSVLVVSDRDVLDKQLREAVHDFERTLGVVASIDGKRRNDGGKSMSKSAALTQALVDGKKIIVCTLQTFPYALEEVRRLSATEGKRFAVIADEAHSSQAGEASAKLRQVLSAEELADLDDGGSLNAEDILTADMKARASSDGVTFIAFTATPKTKTLELFGLRDAAGLPRPFHVYSMRQAIEEGFILDVLQNYIPYRLAFRLTHEGRDWDEKTVERAQAVKQLMQWVRLHPHNIAQKVQVVIEHYRQVVQRLLNGEAKAMVVTASRKEAVRWKKAMQAYIDRHGYRLGVLVAFSGEVADPDSYPEPVTEKSPTLNPGLNGRDIRDAFADPSYNLLLVANKFQTGFDQPLLCGMYVDRRLAGVQAVQTLSRLNRAYPGKDTTYILDFVNDGAEILTAFHQYYDTAQLEAATDPNRIFDLRTKLDATGFYDTSEVERVVHVELNPRARQADLVAAITPVADRLLKMYRAARDERYAAEERHDTEAAHAAKDRQEALVLFKNDAGAFVRLYTFMSQLFDYGDTEVEKRFIFYKRLIPLLDFGREREDVDLSKVVLTHHRLQNTGARRLDPGNGEPGKLKPIQAVGSGSVQDKEKARLSEIVEKVNSLFEGELTESNKVNYLETVAKVMLENETLQLQAASNSKEQFSSSPDLSEALTTAIMDNLSAHESMSTQALNSIRVREGIMDLLMGPLNLYEKLRESTDGPIQ